jgi:hypothetical protein
MKGASSPTYEMVSSSEGSMTLRARSFSLPCAQNAKQLGLHYVCIVSRHSQRILRPVHLF